ncbi:MAG: peptidoglycan DD-metalloendopeptidase family protein [Candidatus Yanofskybacteria bacterium]|nr:peptidoglycan DD-metalloendopeptidase family protein [Candidatus Yanofskybacteria bacterium]
MLKLSSNSHKLSRGVLIFTLLAACYLLLAAPVFALDDTSPVRSQTSVAMSADLQADLTSNGTSQKILDLRKQIEELTKQAEQYKGTIAQKQKQADTLKKQIDILNNQILQLQTKIVITDRQVTSTKLEIVDLEGQIFDASEKINKQKLAVGELLLFLYEQDRLSLLAVLLKSPRLSDFTDQAHQVQNLNNKLVGLLTELKTQKEDLEQGKQKLDLKKSELEALNSKQVSQKIALSGNKVGKDVLLAQTKGQEAKYQQLLSSVEKKKAEFFAELQKFEAEAVKSGAFIVHVTADSVPMRGSKIFQWPYDDYYLTQGYGMTAYARRGAYGGAPHNGIDIAAGYGTPIRPVASGAILASGFNNGFGNWVAVRHDRGLVTVYAHMRSPSGLVNGTPVTANSIIGYEGSTGNSTGSHLHLSLYRDFFTYINDKNGQLYFNYFDGSLNPLDYL